MVPRLLLIGGLAQMEEMESKKKLLRNKKNAQTIIKIQ
jgi:hypothetical protein